MKNYFSSHAVDYTEPEQKGLACIPILHFLYGQPWDQLALNYVHSVRPSCIRVVHYHERQTTDFISYRVTVTLDDRELICIIQQEVSVGLEGGFEHGHDLYIKAKKRGISL